MLKRVAGFSLVELLMAMVAGLLVLAGALSLFTTVLATGSTNLMLSRLNQEVQGVADLISRDLQKAGYHPQAAADSAGHYLFVAADDIYSEPGLHCLRVKYWDATESSGKESKVHVYSYHSTSQKLTLYTKLTANNLAPLHTYCGRGAQLISSAEIHITQLLFTPISHAGATSIKLRISAAYAKRPHLTMTLERDVYLRNGGA